MKDKPFIMILGIAQDGGIPHAGCGKLCCQKSWSNLSKRKLVTCLAIIDPISKQRWLIDATPDIKFQINNLHAVSESNKILDGIFLTHGHVGHYTGLLQLEKAVLNTFEIPVFVMPKLKRFIESNQPWSNLATSQNINLIKLTDQSKIVLNERISIIPFLVPHRAEYSETVGFQILGSNKKIIFIPDIDSWDSMDTSIENLIFENDLLFLDGTFFDGKELPNRDISKVPHPLISQSIKRFKTLPKRQKTKIKFIHFNHTNKVRDSKSTEHKQLMNSGLGLAKEGMKIIL